MMTEGGDQVEALATEAESYAIDMITLAYAAQRLAWAADWPHSERYLRYFTDHADVAERALNMTSALAADRYTDVPSNAEVQEITRSCEKLTTGFESDLLSEHLGLAAHIFDPTRFASPAPSPSEQMRKRRLKRYLATPYEDGPETTEPWSPT